MVCRRRAEPAIGLAFFSLAADAVILQRELVVFPQGMSHPVFRTEDAPQIGVIQKLDSHQIVSFPFMPIRNGPHVRNGGDAGEFSRNVIFPAGQFDFDGDAVPVRETCEVVDHFHVRIVAKFCRFLRIGFAIIDTTQVVQMVEQQAFVVFQKCRDGDNLIARDFDPGVNRFLLKMEDNLVPELFQKNLVNFLGSHERIPIEKTELEDGLLPARRSSIAKKVVAIKFC